MAWRSLARLSWKQRLAILAPALRGACGLLCALYGADLLVPAFYDTQVGNSRPRAPAFLPLSTAPSCMLPPAEQRRLCFVGRGLQRLLPGVVDKQQKQLPERNAMGVGLMDYSAQATSLFGNMVGPATFLAGSILPLGFIVAPLPTKGDTPRMKRAKEIHFFIATVAICCELMAVMWSTIATNKLTEVRAAPASSVMELLKRDYELEWLGCNVHFMLGLLGFASCIVSFACLNFGPARRYVSCFVLATICLMVSMVNDGVSKGEGVDGGVRFASNFPMLILRYMQLFMARAVSGTRVLAVGSIALYVASAVIGLRVLFRTKETQEEDA